MKIIDGILAFILNLCLLFATAVGAVFAIASSPAYYYQQFEVTGIYAQVDDNGERTPKTIYFINGDSAKYAHFTDEQLNELVDHIIEYLFEDGDSFELIMDDVLLNGIEQDGVSVFGEIAVVHMQDVKGLLQTLGTVALTMGVVGSLILGYFIVQTVRGKGGRLLKSTLIFYGTFVGLIVGFCLFTLVQTLAMEVDLQYYLSMIWRNFHFIIFPNPEQALGSFFNDTLTMILTLDLFMAAVVQVLVTIACAVAVWIALAWVLDKRVKKLNEAKGV